MGGMIKQSGISYKPVEDVPIKPEKKRKSKQKAPIVLFGVKVSEGVISKIER